MEAQNPMYIFAKPANIFDMGGPFFRAPPPPQEGGQGEGQADPGERSETRGRTGWMWRRASGME